LKVAAHTAEQKRFIVLRLAAFETPRDIAIAFATRFKDTACNENDVLASDPRIAVVEPDLYKLFYDERKRIVEDPNAAPFAEQRARLIVLSRQAERYENNNQFAEARAVFRQIAEELGLIGPKGKPIPAVGETIEEVTRITRTIIDPKENNGDSAANAGHSNAESISTVTSTEKV
jgi:hypothetical protein